MYKTIASGFLSVRYLDPQFTLNKKYKNSYQIYMCSKFQKYFDKGEVAVDYGHNQGRIAVGLARWICFFYKIYK